MERKHTGAAEDTGDLDKLNGLLSGIHDGGGEGGIGEGRKARTDGSEQSRAEQSEANEGEFVWVRAGCGRN